MGTARRKPVSRLAPVVKTKAKAKTPEKTPPESFGACSKCGFVYEDARRRCWKCGTRPCEKCGRETGSVFLAWCFPCEGVGRPVQTEPA